jgi:hypothetical protein
MRKFVRAGIAGFATLSAAIVAPTVTSASVGAPQAQVVVLLKP